MENNLAVLGSAAYGIVFFGVLAEYTGVPFPGSILLILAGALSYEGQLNGFAIFFLSFIAASMGDAVWFGIGRARGQIFLDGYCRLSLGSENCVKRTQDFFRRFPKASLLVGKFVPGLSAFVVPVAGFSGMGYRDFIRLDSGGIFLWVASLLTIGFWAGGSVDRLLANARGSRSVFLVFSAVFVICFYAMKFWRLKRFGRAEIGKVQNGGSLMPIFKIWHIGTKEVSIEEGGSPEEACRKAGWKSEDCEVEVIPHEQIINLEDRPAK